ncbi:MAG: thioesterase family protein [Opitutaceae bacterium]|tara:strand:- start:7095 stop:7505 length:411 start_codon:yes stop_codon:yes gene_type:complete
MPTFRYNRTIHFSDTDAAGVVFFARYLSIAHEAYEEALGANGILLAEFFSDNGVVIPITRSEASYLRPLHAGEKICVDVTPVQSGPHSYTLDTTIWKIGPPEKKAAVIQTEHVCITSTDRKKIDLPSELTGWIDAD